MAVKISPKQQETYKEIAQNDPEMAKKVVSAMNTLNKMGFTFETAKAAMKLCLDVSGSTANLYRSGLIQKLVEQYLALALFLDDNQNVDVYAFDEGVYELPSATPQNYKGYVDNNVTKLVGGGTHYGPAIKAVADGLEKNMAVGLCAFFTDGQNFDPKQATQAIIQASQKPLFFQFAGIGEPSQFGFLKGLDTLDDAGQLRAVDNAGFFLTKLDETDEQLMWSLLQEFAAVDASTGKPTGKDSYPIKCQKIGILNENYMWPGNLAPLPTPAKKSGGFFHF